MFGRRGREKKIRQTDLLPCLPLPEVEVSGVRLSPFLPTSSDAALFERLTAIVETTTANNTLVDLTNTIVDLPNTMVDLPNTMVDLPNTHGRPS